MRKFQIIKTCFGVWAEFSGLGVVMEANGGT